MSFLLKFLFPSSGFFASVIQLFGSVIPKVFEFVQPLWVLVVQFLGWYFKQFWSGLTSILHNIAILTVIAPLVLFSMGYVKFKEEKQCKDTIATIHEEYTLIKKKNGKVEKKLVNKEVTYKEWNPLKGIWEAL